MNKYFKQYKWSNIFSMLRNNRSSPEICKEGFEGRLVVITGATSGIGRAAAEKFASHGADLLTVNRNETKSQQFCAELQETYNVNCSYLTADFSKLPDIHAAAKKLAEWKRDIDVLIHNAGTYLTRKEYTEDGLEMVFQTNYLSTFIINHYLKEKFRQQTHGRILFVNSEAHRFAVWGLKMDDLFWEQHSYSGLKSYGAAKLAQLLSMIKFNSFFSGTNVTINAMHPGNIKTNSGQNNGILYKFFKRNLIDRTSQDAEIAAEALYYLAVSPQVDTVSGKFFNLTTLEEPAPPALDVEEAEKIWAISLEIGGVNE